MTNIFAISGLINGLVALFFGCLVFLKDKKNIVYRTVSALSIATALWGFGYWRWQLAVDYETALFWVRILTIGSTMIPVFYFHWIVSLLGQKERFKFLVKFSYILCAFFLVFSFSPLFIAGLKPALFFPFWPEPGIFYHFYLVFFYFTLTALSLILLVIEYGRSKGFKKEQIKYVILGSVIGFGGGLTNFFLWYDVQVVPWGTFLVSVYTIVFTYSIIRHRLMDMMLVFKKSTIYLMSVFTIVFSLSFIRLFLVVLPDVVALWIDIFLLTLGIIFYPKIRDFYSSLARKYFFTEDYDKAKIFEELNSQLATVNQKEEIYKIIIKVIRDNFLTHGVAFLSFDQVAKKYHLEYEKGLGDVVKKNFSSNTYLYRDFILRNEPIMVEEVVGSFRGPKGKETLRVFDKKNIEIILPIVFEKKVLGILALSEKEHHNIYNQEDLEVLKIIASNMAISLQNAILFDEVRQFNHKLKQKVKEATADLRQANKHLKELDRAKTEFLSIASHQLRTPMTGIKGCLSMLLEGDFGKFNKKQSKVIADVYRNSERMVRMVNTFLDVTRIESGRLMLIENKFDMVELVERSVDTLKLEAENKGLVIKLEKSKKAINVVADSDKLQDVVLNLIDNAIKYTERGEILVTIGTDDRGFIFSVKDSGIGLSAEEKDFLFTKMKRGNEGLKMNTDGCGLGLFIVKKIVDLHHGQIKVNSEGRGFGTTFEVVIPLKQKKK